MFLSVAISEYHKNQKDKTNFEPTTCTIENQVAAVKVAGAPIPGWMEVPTPQGFENPRFPPQMVARASVWYDTSKQIYTTTTEGCLQVEEQMHATEAQTAPVVQVVMTRPKAKAAPAGIRIDTRPALESAAAGGAHDEQNVDWSLSQPGTPAAKGGWTTEGVDTSVAPVTPNEAATFLQAAPVTPPYREDVAPGRT